MLPPPPGGNGVPASPAAIVRAWPRVRPYGQACRNGSARDREASRAFERLTNRERDALLALAEGMNDKEIAGKLGVRPATAHSYVASMLGKLGAHSRLQALVFAARHGFVRIGPEEAP